MRQKSKGGKTASEKLVKDIRRKTRKVYSAEEKVRIVLDGLRGELSIAALCRHEGIAESLYYKWSKDFLEAGKKRFAASPEEDAKDAEIKRLKRELDRVTEERDILKKATAYFARDAK